MFSRHADERLRYPSPETEPEAFIESLRRVLVNDDIDVVLPVAHETTKLCSEHVSDLSEHAELPVAEWETFRRGFDKAETLAAADRAGVPRPKTVYPETPEEADSVAETLTFPVVVKPRRGAGSRGIAFVDNPESFSEVYRERYESHDRPLVQERLPAEGRGLGVGVLRGPNGTVRAEFAYRRLREYPPSGGPSTLRESVEGKQIRAYARDLLEELDWEGVAMVEFKRDTRDGDPKLMEVNPRFWGSLHLPLHAGVDFPWLLFQQALGRRPTPQTEYSVPEQCRYLFPGDLLYLLSKRDREAVSEFFPLRGHQYDVLDRDDPLPTVGRLLSASRFAFSPRMWRRVVFR